MESKSACDDVHIEALKDGANVVVKLEEKVEAVGEKQVKLEHASADTAEKPSRERETKARDRESVTRLIEDLRACCDTQFFAVPACHDTDAAKVQGGSAHSRDETKPQIEGLSGQVKSFECIRKRLQVNLSVYLRACCVRCAALTWVTARAELTMGHIQSGLPSWSAT